MSDIINLPQFKKLVPKRKNERNPILKEEDRVLSNLKDLKNENKISEELFDKIKPTGSQPPRLYGLAKVHKKNTPMRPVLSMPGSPYYKVANQVAKWLSVVEECNINSSTKDISNVLNHIKLKDNEELVSFDVTSLYTNVPLNEAIDDCTNLLYSGKYAQPPVDKETFRKLTMLCSEDVIMSTHDGYYQQIDGLAMGSPPAPMLANGWLSKFDRIIKEEADLYSRYMDDILRNIESDKIETKLDEINSLHPSLKFTIEREENGSIAFLDMSIQRTNGILVSKWYTKPTDTGLTMNYHAIAPKRYKRSVVSGFIYRVYRACSDWKSFHESLIKAKRILRDNQYPADFYDPIISATLNKIIKSENPPVEEIAEKEDQKPEEKLLFVQYRGKVSENFEQTLRKIKAPCRVIFTMNKLKSSLPPLKPPIEKCHKSGVVYKFSCPRCSSCYVGQTSRHLICRFKEHRRSGPVAEHWQKCGIKVSLDDVIILTSRAKSIFHLMTLEALYINELKPCLNKKDEYKSRPLVIKF